MVNIEGILKFLGFGEQSDSPLTYSDKKKVKTETETPTELEKQAEQLDKWLAGFVPIHEKSQISPRRKLFKCLILSGGMVWSAVSYTRMPADITKKLKRRYRRVSGFCFIGFTYLLVCRWFDMGLYKPVAVEHYADEVKVMFLLRCIRKKLTPEKGSMIDRYVLGNNPDSSKSEDSDAAK